MNRRASAFLVPLALLTACGGGGGKGGSLPPSGNTPQSKKTGTATFSFALPGKNTMTRVRRPYYQSQATQGVAIDWLSTNPNVPDYAAAISAVCPATLPAGVVACTIDGQGNTDYSFQLQIPAGTYNLTVSTFDTAPSGGTFTGNMLAQGQLAAPVVITGGTSNTIPALTFYGVPASVSFVPGPAQSHVVTFQSGYAIIGNTAQVFYTQALDADGFIIASTDTGAAALSVAEAASDSPQYFTVATTADPNEFTLTAITGGTAAGSINVTATPGGTGLTPVAQNFPVRAVQELWTTQEAGSYPVGIYGYPLYPGQSVGNPIDGYADPVGNPLCGGSSSCNFQIATEDPSSGTIYAVGTNGSGIPGVYAFTQGTASQGLVPPGGPVYSGVAGDNLIAIATDSAHHGFLIDDNSGSMNFVAYSTASNGWSGVAATTNSQNANLNTAQSLAVAPATVPSALVGSIWVGLSSGGVLVYPAFSGSLTSSPALLSGPDAMTEGFDVAGHLWISTGSALSVYSVSGTPAAPTMTLLGSTALVQPGAYGSSFGAAAPDVMWFGEGGGEELNFDYYTATCGGSSCTIVPTADGISTSAGGFAAFVTP